MNTVGVVCNKDGFGVTVVTSTQVDDHDISIPGSLAIRGEALAWLLDEAQRIIGRSGASEVRIQKAGAGKFGASAERHEVEACVKIAAFKSGARVVELTKEQVRSALGVPKGVGAYEKLLSRADVQQRSNLNRRHQYLLALAGAV